MSQEQNLSVFANNITTANSTGLYYAGIVNAASYTVGASFIANTTKIVIGTSVAVQANGDVGTSGQVLTSNGTATYWANGGGSKGMSYGYSILFGG